MATPDHCLYLSPSIHPAVRSDLEEATLVPSEKAVSSAWYTFPPETYVTNSLPPSVKSHLFSGTRHDLSKNHSPSFSFLFFFFWQAGGQTQGFANVR